MKDPGIDRILSAGDEIVPSSGFSASVMEAVRREVSAPPPIPFPWKRALPGIVVAILSLALLVVVGVIALVQVSQGKLALGGAPISSSLSGLPWQGPIGSMIAWTGLALIVAWVSVVFSMRLTAGKA